MSQQGIRGFYQLTETIKDTLLADVNCNTVTTGDIYDVNLNKQDIFWRWVYSNDLPIFTAFRHSCPDQ